MQLSVYLFSERITSLEGVKKRAEDAGYEEVAANPGVEGVAAFQKVFFHRPPDWVKWVEPWFPIDEANAGGTSLALIMFLLIEKRVFAVPFGFGHTSIDKQILERDFGFQAALRLLKPDELSLIDIRNMGKRTRQKRSLLSFRGTIQEFDVAIDNEMAFKIAGNSDDGSFGKRVVGGTSFAFDRKDDAIEELKDKCRTLLGSLKQPVKRDFEHVNPYQAENDESVLKELDEWLIACLRDGELNSISVAIPELEVTLAADFCLSRGSERRELDELVIEEVADELIELCGGVPEIEGTYVQAYDADGHPLPKQVYPLRDCLVAERQSIDHAEVIYVLSLGKWHRVKRSFIDQVERELSRIEVNRTDGFLPGFAHKDEEDYNQSVAQGDPKRFVLCDRKLFSENLGCSSVEICDLYTDKRQLICVKPYHSSQSISHLSSQGLVSARFLKNDVSYRKELISRIGSIGQFALDSFDERDFTFIYAIVFDRNKSIPTDLPFFSKVRLIEDARTIKGMDFKVELYHIPMTPKPKPKKSGQKTGDASGNGKKPNGASGDGKKDTLKKVKATSGKSD